MTDKEKIEAIKQTYMLDGQPYVDDFDIDLKTAELWSEISHQDYMEKHNQLARIWAIINDTKCKLCEFYI